MPRVYVGIGSNLERERHIRAAVHALIEHFGKVMLSPVYESKAHGFDGGDFYNLVAGFETTDSIEHLKDWLSRTETRFGRERQGRRLRSRTLDLDLLLYGSTVRHDDHVDLPHPDILRYAFVLRPLADIAPELVHPESGESFARQWSRFNVNSQEIRKTEFDPIGPVADPT